MKAKNKFKKYIIFCFIFIFLFSFKTIYAKDEDFYTITPIENIKKSYETKKGDIKNLNEWISSSESYVMIKDNGNGNYTYYWNVPNFQQLIYNSFYGLIIQHGYGNGIGIVPYKNSWIVKEDPTKAKTAMQKYGFNIPTPVYTGERPIIMMDLTKIAMPKGALDSLWRGIKYVFTGEIVPPINSDLLDTMIYYSPRGYDYSAHYLENWIFYNWDSFIDNNKVPEGQIVMNGVDEKGFDTDGEQWVKNSILKKMEKISKKDPSKMLPKNILKLLKDISGNKFNNLMSNIMKATTPKEYGREYRQMPYDISSMSVLDRQLFKFQDPRSRIQQSLLNTGYDNYIKLNPYILKISSSLAETTIGLNKMANWGFIESVGLNPVNFWQSTLIRFFIGLFWIGYIILLLKWTFEFFSNRIELSQALSKIVAGFIISLLLFGFSYKTETFYSMIKNTSSKIFDIGNMQLERNPNIGPLYGEGNSLEKENTKLWLPYFDLWTKYQSGGIGILDNRQKLDIKDGTNETVDLEVPKIGNTNQNLWSTILADSFTSGKVYSTDIYRFVDHFMAPRIKVDFLDNKIKNIDIKENENYHLDIQTDITIIPLFNQLLIFLLTVFKLLMFIELFFNLSILFIRIFLSIFERNLLKESFGFIFANILTIMMLNQIITFIIVTSLNMSNDIGLLVFTIGTFLVLKSIIKALLNSKSMFRPFLLSWIYNKISILINASKIKGF